MGRQPCCEKVGLKRGPWTIDEDSKLVDFILNNGIQCWRLVPKLAGLMRCGKSCRLRWINYLRPDLKRGAFTEAEEDMIIELHSRLGNRWSKIAAHLPGRTDNEIKNHWNTKIKKKLKLLGLDPITHKPIEHKSDQEIHQNMEVQEPKDCQILQEKTQEALISGPNQGKNECFMKNMDMGSSLMIESLEPIESWMDNLEPFLWDGFSNFGDSFPWKS